MSHLLDENDELLASSAREMTLGTASILGIFFGLALLCALFFGFGYNVGHKSATAALVSATPEPDGPASVASMSSADTFKSFKPAPAKTSPAAPVEESPDAASDSASAGITPPHTAAASAPVSRPAATPHFDAPARPTPGSGVPSRPSAEPPSSSAEAAGAPGVFFVQVAAVSHPEDALLLLGALRTKGYAVTQRSEATDKLIHIQVGPFASKPLAEAMRQRLQSDGYNAILK